MCSQQTTIERIIRREAGRSCEVIPFHMSGVACLLDLPEHHVIRLQRAGLLANHSEGRRSTYDLVDALELASWPWLANQGEHGVLSLHLACADRAPMAEANPREALAEMLRGPWRPPGGAKAWVGKHAAATISGFVAGVFRITSVEPVSETDSRLAFQLGEPAASVAKRIERHRIVTRAGPAATVI